MAPVESLGGEEPLLQRLVDSLKDSRAEKEEKKAPKVVHLLKNQPPLPSKVVERIRERAFVEFATFPVFDDGPNESGELKMGSGETEESATGGVASRRRNTKEIPDLAGWSTCFTLFQVAWASSEPEMWAPLAAYREVIFKLARRHQWSQVVRYDRRLRREAAGKEEVKWDEENLSLLLDIVHSAPQGRPEPKQSTSGSGPVPRRPEQSASGSGPAPRRPEQRRKGACFRFNRGEGRCGFGAQCRFSHTCSNCGGEHPATSCKSWEKK